jgi:hypothetical protein
MPPLTFQALKASFLFIVLEQTTPTITSATLGLVTKEEVEEKGLAIPPLSRVRIAFEIRTHFFYLLSFSIPSFCFPVIVYFFFIIKGFGKSFVVSVKSCNYF